MFCRDFSLHGGSACENDFLEIREGNATGPLVGCFSGGSLPSNYTSVTAHILWMRFVSDASVSGAGFRATFSHCECSQTSAHTAAGGGPSLQLLPLVLLVRS